MISLLTDLRFADNDSRNACLTDICFFRELKSGLMARQFLSTHSRLHNTSLWEAIRYHRSQTSDAHSDVPLHSRHPSLRFVKQYDDAHRGSNISRYEAAHSNEAASLHYCTGMGGGGIMTLSSIVASDIIPTRKRGFIQYVAKVVSNTHVLTSMTAQRHRESLLRRRICFGRSLGRVDRLKAGLASGFPDAGAFLGSRLDSGLPLRPLHSAWDDHIQACRVQRNRLAWVHHAHHLHLGIPACPQLQEQFRPSLVTSQSLGELDRLRGLPSSLHSGGSLCRHQSRHATSHSVSPIDNLHCSFELLVQRAELLE